MHPIMLDTNAYVAFKRGNASVITVLEHAPDILVPTTVLGELLGGFAFGPREPSNRVELTRFLESPRVKLVPVTSATADLYAMVHAALRRKGQPVPTNDLWIAASSLEHGAALLTLDSHFRKIDGLRQGTCLEEFIP